MWGVSLLLETARSYFSWLNLLMSFQSSTLRSGIDPGLLGKMETWGITSIRWKHAAILKIFGSIQAPLHRTQTGPMASALNINWSAWKIISHIEELDELSWMLSNKEEFLWTSIASSPVGTYTAPSWMHTEVLDDLGCVFVPLSVCECRSARVRARGDRYICLLWPPAVTSALFWTVEYEMKSFNQSIKIPWPLHHWSSYTGFQSW